MAGSDSPSPPRPAKKAYIRLRWVGKKFTRKLSSCQQSVLKNLQEMWPGTSWAHQNFIGKMPAGEGAVKLAEKLPGGSRKKDQKKVAVEALLHRKLLVMGAAPSRVYTPAPTTETKEAKHPRTRKKTCLLQCSFKEKTNVSHKDKAGCDSELRPNGWITGVLGLYMSLLSETFHWWSGLWIVSLPLLCTQVYCSLSSAAMCLHPYSEGEGISCSSSVCSGWQEMQGASSFPAAAWWPSTGRSQEEASSVFPALLDPCWGHERAFMEAGIPFMFLQLRMPLLSYWFTSSYLCFLPHFLAQLFL